ncbi:MAG: class B sortase [Eubacterium sp.]|nr:class B sortase [Eubacterium sp.]
MNFSDKKLSRPIIDTLCTLVIVLSLGGLGYAALPYIGSLQTDSTVSQSSQDAIDFDALKAINPDTVGWIKIDGTTIDYPVVQADNNEKYLSTTFEGENNPLWGAIFLDCAYAPDHKPAPQNSVVYGHSNLGKPSPFGDLFNYKDEAFFEEHRTITYSRPGDQNAQWEIFSVFLTEADLDYRRPDFTDAEDFLSYFESIKALSLYATDTVLDPQGEILTLSTCDFNVDGIDDPRLVVVAQKMDN